MPPETPLEKARRLARQADEADKAGKRLKEASKRCTDFFKRPEELGPAMSGGRHGNADGDGRG